MLRDNARPYAANANFTIGLFNNVTRSNCTSTSCGAGLLDVLAALQAARALSNPLPVANVPHSRVVASDGGIALPADLSSNGSAGSANLTFSWQQVFGNPVVLAGTTGSTLQVQSGMTSNIAEFALTVTDTSTNRSNTSVVRLANVSANERTFTPSVDSSGGDTSTSTSPVSATQGGGGGGGGAMGLAGLLGLGILLAVWRRILGVN